MTDSCGSWSRTARATVSPPKLLSKIPIGESATQPSVAAGARRSRICETSAPSHRPVTFPVRAKDCGCPSTHFPSARPWSQRGRGLSAAVVSAWLWSQHAPGSATLELAAPSAGPQQPCHVLGHLTGLRIHIGPSEPKRDLAADRRVVVPGAVTKHAVTLVANAAVKLDDNAEGLVLVVGAAPAASDHRDLLSPRPGQTVRSLDTSDVAVLEEALDPIRHVTECIDQQLPPAVTGALAQRLRQPSSGRPAMLARLAHPRDRIVGTAALGHVQHSVLDCGP